VFRRCRLACCALGKKALIEQRLVEKSHKR
jgi:hypothetical protein